VNLRLRIGFGVVAAVTLGLCLINIGSVPLLDPDESRFARTSVEMLRNQDPVVPSFEGRPRLVKPPLMHWVQSFFFATFGVDEWVARLHAVLATLTSIGLVGLIAGRRFGPEGALWSAVFMISMPLVVVLGHLGTLDALLAMHVLAIVALDLNAEHRPGSTTAIAIGALLGLAFLVKGPVGVILPLLVQLAGRTAARREILPSVRRVMQAATAWCVVVLPWGLAFLNQIGPGEINKLLGHETLQRFASGTDHVHPWWYYAPVVAVGLLPWAAPLVVAVVRALIPGDRPRSNTAAYAAAGLLAGLVFFSLGKGKLPSYIVPLAPLAAWLLAWQVGEDLRGTRRGWAGGLTVLTLALAGPLLLAAGGEVEDAQIRRIAAWSAVLFGGGAVAAATGWLRRSPRLTYGAAAATSAGFLFILLGALGPHLSMTRTSAHLVEAVPALEGSRSVVRVGMKLPSLTFYLDRIPEEVDLVDVDRRLDRGDDPLLVFDLDDLANLPRPSRDRLREVGRQGKYAVLEIGGRE